MSLNRTLAGLITTTGDVKSANLDLAASITVVEALDSLPTSNLTAGDQAYVKGTSRFYVSNGSGWYNAALVNATPSLSIDPSGAITLATDGSTTTITLTATDSDYPDAALTYTVESDGSFGGLATVSQDSSVFTITPLSEDSATTTSAVLTFKASDGVSFGSGDRTLTLEFKVANSNYTTLMLKADTAGTDNQVDASTNNYTITENGNVKSTALSPYHPGGYSTYFDGTGDFLTVGSNADIMNWLKNGSQAEGTLEAWVYLTTLRSGSLAYTHPCIFGNGSTYLNFGVNNGQLRLYYWTGSENNIDPAGATLSAHRWYHVALTQDSSNTLRIFLDGALVSTTTSFPGISWASASNGNSFYVGAEGSNPATSAWLGYIRDARISTTARYTATFTPPTAPLTAIANTSLLACHLPYIADGSTNSHTITVNGNTSTKRFGPYDYEKYTEANYGGSVYHDGNGDYINIAGSNLYSVGSVSGEAFTIEFWFNYSAVGSNGNGLITKGTSGSTGSGDILTMDLNPSTRVISCTLDGTYSGYELVGNTVLKENVWYHIALVKNTSNVYKLYINGAQETATYTATGTISASTNFYVGTNYYAVSDAARQPTAYFSDVRVVSDAVYTSAFTPPTEPLTAITNTELLTCTNQNDIWDASAVQPLLSRFNSIAAAGTKSGWSNNSIYFNRSSSQYMTIPQSDNLVFGTGDFTLETWVFFNTISDFGAIFDFRTTGTQVAPLLWAHFDNYFYWYINATTQIKTADNFISANTWYHLAVARSGSSTKMFVNGTQQGSTYADTNNYVAPGAVYIGRSAISDDHHLNGYLIDTRITKGLARYTTNFTPPTTDFSG